jgi:hypothetical protein
VEIDAKSTLRGGHETQTYAMGSSWVRIFPFHRFSSGCRVVPLRFAIPLAYGVCSSIGMGPSFSQLLVNHDQTLAHRLQILHSVWHDTACFFRLRLSLLFDFYYLHLTTWPVRAHHLYLQWGMRPMTLVVAVPYMEDMKMLSLDNNTNNNNSMSSCPTLVIR